MKRMPTRGDYWLWIGPVVDDQALLAGRAVSPAANRWQLGLLDAVRAFGVEVEVISYLPEPYWPHGKLIVRQTKSLQSNTREVAYLNMPIVRDQFLFLTHRRAIKRMCFVRGGAPRVVFTYNVQPAYVKSAEYCRRRWGTPWIPVVADGPGDEKKRRWHTAEIARAAGRIHLSWSAYCEDTSRCKFHLDGGVEAVPPPKKTLNQRVALYSGALTEYGGVALAIEAFKMIPDPQARLWICGKGQNILVDQAVSDDPRITCFGLVSESVLGRLFEDASVFVNPRPQGLVASHFNFPSKVLEYLRLGKPVVSTWTGGLAPEYRDVLLVAPDDPAGFAAVLQTAFDMDEIARSSLQSRIQSFLTGSRLWSTQAKRLSNWVNSWVDS